MTERRAQRIPTPPTMHNRGFYTASICEIVRWLGERAEALGVNLFAGFPVDALLVDGHAVRGVRTTPSGLARDGTPGPNYTPPTDLTARVTVVAEGTRGAAGAGLARVAARVVAQPADLRARREGAVGGHAAARRGGPYARLAAAAPTRSAEASCTRSDRRRWRSVSWSGLDYHDASLDVHELLQRMKLHPLFRRQLEGGQLLEWGAKTIPEGGYYALPVRRERGRRPLRGRHGRLRRRAVAQGHSLRHAVRDVRGAGRVRRAQGRRHVRARRSRATTTWWRRATSWTTCAAPGTCGWRSRRDSIVGGAKAGLMTMTGGRFPGGDDRDGRRTRARAASPARARRSRPMAGSRSASWTRSSSRGTRPGTPSPRTCSSAATFTPRWPTSTRMSAPQACTSGWATSSG